MGDIWVEPDWWTLSDDEEELSINSTTDGPLDESLDEPFATDSKDA